MVLFELGYLNGIINRLTGDSPGMSASPPSSMAPDALQATTVFGGAATSGVHLFPQRFLVEPARLMAMSMITIQVLLAFMLFDCR